MGGARLARHADRRLRDLLESGAEGEATVPSGASTGTHEAHERRDGGERYGGKGVRDAVAAFRAELAPALVGRDVADQAAIDAALRELDGTPSLERLGANAVLAASVACALARRPGAEPAALARALAPSEPPLLPLPMVNVISGGAHAGGLVDVQDFLVVPVGATHVRRGDRVGLARPRRDRATVLRERGHDAVARRRRGRPRGARSRRTARRSSVLRRGRSSAAGSRPAPRRRSRSTSPRRSSLVGDRYVLASEDRALRADELVDEIAGWCRRLPDRVDRGRGSARTTRTGWRLCNRPARRQRSAPRRRPLRHLARPARAPVSREGIANAVLVKPNQIGTLTEARQVVGIAQAAGYATVLSARSGETEDSWLADLAVGWRTGQLKVGSTTRSERTAKWNRLLRIESEYPTATFAGRGALAPRVVAPGQPDSN